MSGEVSREWAARIADKFDSGEMKWTKGRMVAAWPDDPTLPCFCMLGAIAYDIGAVVLDNGCNCGDEDCNFSSKTFENYSFEDDDEYLRRISEFGAWLKGHGYDHWSGSSDTIIEMNDDNKSTLGDVVGNLRRFATEGE